MKTFDLWLQRAVDAAGYACLIFSAAFLLHWLVFEGGLVWLGGLSL